MVKNHITTIEKEKIEFTYYFLFISSAQLAKGVLKQKTQELIADSDRGGNMEFHIMLLLLYLTLCSKMT